MADSNPDPTSIDRLEWTVWPSFAMLAGMQLDLFTPLKNGPISVEEIAAALEVNPDKLKPLLYALASVGLLNVDGDRFSNSAEAGRFLVKGSPSPFRPAAPSIFAATWSTTRDYRPRRRSCEPDLSQRLRRKPGLYGAGAQGMVDGGGVRELRTKNSSGRLQLDHGVEIAGVDDACRSRPMIRALVWKHSQQKS